MEHIQTPAFRPCPAEAGRVELSLRSDFGTSFRFARYEEMLNAEEYGKSLSFAVVGALPLPEEISRGGVSLERCALSGKPALRLYAKIPTFDSYDRESDSWHALVLFGDGDAVHGVYCKGGYRLAHVFRCFRAVELPDSLRACLAAEGIG